MSEVRPRRSMRAHERDAVAVGATCELLQCAGDAMEHAPVRGQRR